MSRYRTGGHKGKDGDHDKLEAGPNHELDEWVWSETPGMKTKRWGGRCGHSQWCLCMTGGQTEVWNRVEKKTDKIGQKGSGCLAFEARLLVKLEAIQGRHGFRLLSGDRMACSLSMRLLQGLGGRRIRREYGWAHWVREKNLTKGWEGYQPQFMVTTSTAKTVDTTGGNGIRKWSSRGGGSTGPTQRVALKRRYDGG